MSDVRNETRNADVRALSLALAPRCPLLALAIRLDEELEAQDVGLVVHLTDSKLTLMYRQHVILRWYAVEDDIICSLEWSKATYVAHHPAEAHDTTIRLVFEFVRRLKRSAL